jgi:hypothetical protein
VSGARSSSIVAVWTVRASARMAHPVSVRRARVARPSLEEAGDAAAGERESAAEFGHGQLLVGGAGDPFEDLEPCVRETDGLSQ